MRTSRSSRSARSTAACVLTLLSSAVFSLVVILELISRPMFLDGVHFASVARNLSEGIGTFWAPYYTATLYPIEHEHPPLGFWLQSQAFRFFGDSPYVEALYGYGVGVVTLGMLTVFWNQMRRTERELSHGWPVLLLFACTPVIPRAIANNLLEPMMTVFVLTAVIVGYEALRTDTWWRKGLLSVMAGALTIAGMLVKGPAGAFVVPLPLLAWASLSWVSRRNAAVTQVGILCGMLLVIGVVILPSDGAVAFVRDHFRTQIVPSIAGLREVQSRWHVFGALIAELGVPALVCAGASLLLRVRPTLVRKEACSFFLLLGLAGSLPFIMSPKQPRRYLIPSFPFFLMALSVLFNQLALRIEQYVEAMRRLRWGLSAVSIAILAGAATALASKGGIHKSDAFEVDVLHTALAVEPRTLVQVCPPSLLQEWGLHAKLQRMFKVSLTADPHQPYYLMALGAPCEVPADCTEPLNEHPQRYALYRCRAQR